MANEDGLTVLHNAVCSGCLDVLEFLIESGCDVNVADSDGWYVFTVIDETFFWSGIKILTCCQLLYRITSEALDQL
jgi:hypothetical protein